MLSVCANRLRVAFAALLLAPAWLAAQTISFTFDDGFDPRSQPQARAWNERMLDALAQARVTAMLFPAGKNVDSPDGLALVRAWGVRGHAVGNHTYSHESLGSPKVSPERFTADVIAADRLLADTPGFIRRLRFPYLKEGADADKRDTMRQWMAGQHYLPAPVSIDTSDWYYSQRFVQWRGDHPRADTARFRDAYLAHLWDRARYYDALARSVLQRSPAHVMLLHTNAINAAFLPDVLAMFRQRGWTIASPLQAFADPMYAQQPSALPAGESIVWALAKEAGRPGLRYPAEDDKYEEPVLRAAGF